MWRLTLANASAHRARLALTWLAVALGVAFVSGALVLTDTSTRVLDEQFRSTTAGVDLTVRSAAAFDAAMGVQVQRDPLPVQLAERVGAQPGVASVQAVASGIGQLQAGGTLVEPGGPTLLTSWTQAPFAGYSLRAGHPPHGPGQVVIDAATAGRYDITPGDTVAVSATTGRELQVVGLAGIGELDGLTGSAIVLVDLPTAQQLLGLGGRVNAIEVIARDGVKVADLRTSLAATLGVDYAVTSSQDATAASAAAAEQSIGYLRIMLLALAAAGLMVGAFLIANTFAIVVAQRNRELALLRAAGATGRQIFASVMGEALLVGFTGAAGGAVLGIGAAYGLRALAQGAGLALPDGPLMISGASLGVAVGAGVLVTLLAALGPARRGARIAPVEALRRAAPGPATAGRVRRVAGWSLLGLAATLLTAGAMSRTVAEVAAGALLLIAALIALAPTLIPRLAHAIGRPLARLGVPAMLARESTVRNPRRIAATTIALALSLALISFVAAAGSSVKAMAAAGAETITADLMVQSRSNEMLGGLSPKVADSIARLPGVSAVSRVRFGHWLDDGATSALTAVDPHGLPQVARVQLTVGSLSALDGGGVVLGEQVATERGLRVGDTLAMTFPRDGTQLLPVVGVMTDQSAQALSTDYVISLDSYQSHYSENVDATVYVALAPSADLTQARATLQEAVADFPNAQIRDQAEAAAARAGAIQQVLGLITVLLGFAVLLSLLGITNTLALSITERTREVGLLRAVGMTQGQLRWMIRTEAVLVAAVAAAVGSALGLVLAAATLTAVAPTVSAAVVQVPVGQLLTLTVITLVAGLVAGLLPARRAARLDVLTAIATE